MYANVLHLNAVGDLEQKLYKLKNKYYGLEINN